MEAYGQVDPNEEDEDIGEGDFGCKHYKRACLMQCPHPICEGKFYPCRLCHDEVHYDAETDMRKNHQLDRHAVTRVKCLRCGKEQDKQKTCEECGKDFAAYFCSICCLYDDKAEQKGIFTAMAVVFVGLGAEKTFSTATTAKPA